MAPEDARIDEDFGYEALETAIRGSDVIICCTGASRSTNFIKDFFPPWRIFQKDISNWCHDLRHPYFVNYKGTMKIIEFVQDEVERREKEKEELLEKQKQISSFHREDIEDIEKEKIAPVTIIKISDLMVVSPPWGLVVVLTNLFRSMVFRYQEMAEKALHQASSTGKINTVILRPGDLLDEERDHDEVSLQISPNGVLPGPGLVGRSDVASLAIAAALSFDKKSRHNKKSSKNMGVKGEHLSLPPKTTLAVRWVGENIYPQAQGRAIDGYKDAETCINKLLSKNNKRYEASSSSMLYNNKGNHGTKPYGLFVCMLLSTFMIMLTTLVHPFLLSFFTPSTKNILIQRLSFLIKPIVNIAGSIWNRAPSSVIY